MKAVVTGATGCLGMNLTKRLIKEGQEVIGLGRNPQLGAEVSKLGAQFIAMDLNNLEQLKEVMHDAKHIYHCAALSSPWGRYEDFYQANVLGTRHVVEATPKQARLIHVSSPSIYFDFTEKYNIKENDPLPAKPANYYVQTKLLAEEVVDKAFSEQKLAVVTIRPRAIFGPYDRSILPRIMQSEKNGLLKIIGTGNNLIDITYVDNVVESLVLAAKAPAKVLGKKYNITNDQAMTLMAILTLLYKELGKPLTIKAVSYPLARLMAKGLETLHRLKIMAGEPLFTEYTAGVLALGQTLNIDAAKRDLHYKPIVSIEAGIHEFATWYKHHD